MKYKINFTDNTNGLPINNQDIINAYIHKCLGSNNKYHDDHSNYCISNLCGYNVKIKEDKIFYEKPYLIISFYEPIETTFFKDIIIGINKNREISEYGMKFINIEPIEEIFYDGFNYFNTTDVGFLLKDNSVKKQLVFDTKKVTNNNKIQILDYYDFNKRLKEITLNKLNKINEKYNLKLNLSDFDIQVQNLKNNKVKITKLHNTKQFSNRCQVNVKTNKKVAELLSVIGLGSSTGAGFGTLYKIENKNNLIGLKN